MLRRDVEGLLEADASEGLSRPVGEAAPALVSATAEESAPASGARYGPWRVVRRLGQGGMGAVYLVDRADGAYEQQAALKSLLAGGARHTRRFEQERQILAGLDHPGIARLLDGGLAEGPAGEADVPYLVMEYVQGEPLTAYAERHGLDVRARLALFAQVCDAVGHAHRHLVVHRDIKPSNVFVVEGEEGGPAVKLLDFGIARLAEGPGDALLTRTASPLMTPEYAAPEQVTGAAITTATDVYALGVLLFELLAGRRPYEVAERGLTGLAATICEAVPPALSAAAPGRAGALRGDLDAVVAKALEKEPRRRYGSASDLADDLRRHLGGLPVEARPQTAAYRMGRFVRRHRAGVALAAAVVLVGAASGWFHTTRLAAERDRAETAAMQAEQTAAFLETVLTSADPNSDDPGATSAQDLLDEAALRARDELAEQPAVLARMLGLMGRVYRTLGLYEQAESVLVDAVALFERRVDDPLEHREALLHLANLRYRTERYDEAIQLAERGLRLDSLHAEGVASKRLGLLNTLAIAYSEVGRLEEASAVLAEIIERRRAGEGEDPELNIAANLSNRGLILQDLGRLGEAAPLFDEALERVERERGPDHPYVAFALSARSGLHEARGDRTAALADLRRAQRIAEASLGPEHPFVSITQQKATRLSEKGGATSDTLRVDPR